MDGASALKLILGCTSNSQCNIHEPTCDTLTRTCYNCNHCKYYNCNRVGKRWMHKKCRDHSQLCLPGGLCVDRPKAGLQYLNNYLKNSISQLNMWSIPLGWNCFLTEHFIWKASLNLLSLKVCHMKSKDQRTVDCGLVPDTAHRTNQYVVRVTVILLIENAGRQVCHM